jgi:hypothetical protein
MAEAESSRVGAAREVDPRPIPSAAYSSPPPRRSSWLPGLIGGLLGGAIVAVAGYWYTITQPFVPPVLTARLEALEATRPRLDSVAGEAASLRERSEVTASTIGNLQSRLASLEQAGASAPERLSTVEQATRDLRERLDGARATTDTIAGDVSGRLEELRARVDRLAADTSGLTRAGGEVSAAADRLAALGQGQQQLGGEIGQLRGALDEVRNAGVRSGQEAQAAREAMRQELQQIRTDLGALRGRVDGLQGLTAAVAALEQASGARQAETGQVAEDVAALRRDIEQRLSGVAEQTRQAAARAEERVAARAAEVERAGALALAAYELRNALARGGSVAPTAELITKTAGDDAEVRAAAEALAPAASADVPSLAQLSQRLDAVAEAAAAPPPGEEAKGWLGTAGQNLTGLVQVAPSDRASTTPAGAAVEAARDALAAGDVTAAKAAIEPLAASGNEAARDWIAAADRRLTVASAADRLAARVQAGFASQ